MKKLLIIGLAIVVALCFLSACTSAELKQADAAQQFIDKATPVVNSVVDVTLGVTGKAALVPANDALTGEIEAGQKQLTDAIEAKQQQLTTPATPSTTNK